MKAIIYISGRITKDETLIDVIRQYKSFETPTEVEARIETNGGNKNEGDAVYDYLKNIDAEGVPVTTIASKAYSIGSKIFAAGSTRLVPNEEEVIGIHFARVSPKGTYVAEEVQDLADELFGLKKEFIDFYSSEFDIDKGAIETLLENETVLSGKEAVELGFATGFETVADEIVAELHIDKLNTDKMSTKKESKKTNFIKKFIADISAYLEGEEVVAELTLQDSNATDIVFPDLETGDSPKVGDSANIDGKAIEDGSYVMPSLEDATVVFVDGKVSEINEKEAEETTEEAEEVVAEEVKEVFTYSVEAVNTSFEEGEVLMFKAWSEDGDDYTASAGEYKLKDGSTIVTDASGVIVKKKSAEEFEEGTEPDGSGTEAKETETEANFEEMLGKLTKKVKEEVSAEFKTKFENQAKEIKALKAGKGSKEITAEGIDVDGKGKKEKGNRAAGILAAAKNL